jgi:cyclomaltodextrinase / maltogenic alpha-amylase / neopullulanase
MEELKPGIYRHYKGNKYEVIGTAIHSETEELLVVYRMLYSTGKYEEGTLWVRPKDMFYGIVEVDGQKVPRFEFIDQL